MFVTGNTSVRVIEAFTRTHTATRTCKGPCAQCDEAIRQGDQYILRVQEISHHKFGSRLENTYEHDHPVCPIYRDRE